MQSLLRPDHSLIRDPISALAAGSSGWIQDTNFLAFGTLMIAYGIGLQRGVAPTTRSIVSQAFLVLSGVGLIWAGLFPARAPDGAFEDRAIHTPGFVLTFVGAGIGLILMSRRMRADARWMPLAPYAFATGVATLVLFVIGAVLVRPASGPLHPWLGLFQWILLAVWLPCTVVLARRLLQVAQATTRLR
jgi:hypothetical membrane protein